MDYKIFTYDVCRCYILDQVGLIRQDLIDRLLGKLRSRDIEYLASLSNASLSSDYHDEKHVAFIRQVAAFFKKNAAFSDRDRCSEAAAISFFKAERQCALTNQRLDLCDRHPEYLSHDLSAQIERVRLYLFDTLGSCSDFYDELHKSLRVTSGASSTFSRRKSLPQQKLRIRNLPMTPKCQSIARPVLSRFGFNKVSFSSTCRNRVETVPKNWKTDRTIACEPMGNLPFQLACDDWIRIRLRRRGIDLSDQSRNQNLAKQGSIDGHLATIDISMASDTLSANCVYYLLPYDWAWLLDQFRAPIGEGFGRVFTYSKFSSMGNGYTFTLETLIFAACCKAVGSDMYSVYGDDIIIEASLVAALRTLLAYLGFSINSDKSYDRGYFRESCGSDWYNGVDVTPRYLRFKTGFKVEVVHAVNSMLMCAKPYGKLAAYLVGIVRQERLPFAPFSEVSTSGVWIDTHTCYSFKVFRYSHCMLEYKSFVPSYRSVEFVDVRALMLWHLDAAQRSRYGGADALNYLATPLTGFVDFGTGLFFTPAIVRSRTLTFTNKYKRKWVVWHFPHGAIPDHLSWWSDMITQEIR